MWCKNIRKASPLLVGNSVYNIFFLLKLLDDNLRDNYCSKAAIEMGLLDLMAKSLKLPFHKIISNGFRAEIPLMGWIGQGTAEEAAAKALDFAEKGFTGLKVKVGRDVKGDVQRIKAIRNAVGDEIAVRVDANESYNEDETISLLKSIDDLNIQLCEQPIPRDNHKGLARIRNKTGIPIMADEERL